MNQWLSFEIRRLIENTARRRGDLLSAGLGIAKRRKQLTLLAGILALTSAAAITSVITTWLGTTGLQTVSAIVAGISGAISLMIASHYGDDEIIGRLTGASKYLALRDAVFRLSVTNTKTDLEIARDIEALQAEYTNLDLMFSRYFTNGRNSKQQDESVLPLLQEPGHETSPITLATVQYDLDSLDKFRAARTSATSNGLSELGKTLFDAFQVFFISCTPASEESKSDWLGFILQKTTTDKLSFIVIDPPAAGMTSWIVEHFDDGGSHWMVKGTFLEVLPQSISYIEQLREKADSIVAEQHLLRERRKQRE